MTSKTAKARVKGADGKKANKSLKKAPNKARADRRRDEATRFKEGNTARQKYTEKSVVVVLEKMYAILATDEKTKQLHENPVRANSIKLQKEVCIMAGVTYRRFIYWKEWFTHEKRRNPTTGESERNPYYSEPVSELMDLIQDICECRLQYSGNSMDQFILRNHYNWSDERSVDLTTKGEALQTPVSAAVTIITQN